MPTVLYTQQLAAKLGKTTEALRTLRLRNPKNIPSPNGRIGRRDYWLSESVDEWLLNGGQLERKRGRPRLVPEHIKLTHV